MITERVNCKLVQTYYSVGVFFYMVFCLQTPYSITLNLLQELRFPWYYTFLTLLYQRISHIFDKNKKNYSNMVKGFFMALWISSFSIYSRCWWFQVKSTTIFLLVGGFLHIKLPVTQRLCFVKIWYDTNFYYSSKNKQVETVIK